MNLTFLPPQISIEPEFWSKLYNYKLNLFKLDDKDQPLTVFYSLLRGLCLNSNAFDLATTSNNQSNGQQFTVSGILKNVNTLNVRTYF